MKMLGKSHRKQCDCLSSHVSGREEKCHKIHGNGGKRSREKREFFKEIKEL